MASFPDPVHDEFAGWLRGFSPYGGGDAGEIDAMVAQVGDGDDSAFFEALQGYALRRIDEADAALAAGHRATARECYLRAAVFLGVAYHPLFGKPVDPRLVDAWHLQIATFDQGLALMDPPGEPIDIPYEGTKIPARFLQAPANAGQVRPTIIVGGGWDSTMIENYFGLGAAALARGYHVLLVDGPGQGHLLFVEGLPLRHDWEKVITPVVDVALTLPLVDADRLVYEPWSLGGYMAPRAAAYEHRLAAIVADPGQIDVGGKVTGALALFGFTPEAIARLPEMRAEDAKAAMDVITSDRSLDWRLVKRGFWANGADDFPGFVAEMMRWKLTDEEVASIRCPTLVTMADDDRASTNAQELYDKLTCPKRLIHFTAADGANQHCEALNRSMANRQILDWLDDTLGLTR